MEIVKKFLLENWDQKSPLLLGYSGGPDSKALLYSFLASGFRFLHVAHVDHGWRLESGEEARLIREEIESLGLPFYTTRLLSPLKNKEAIAREERFMFFFSLFEKIPFQALLLAHHGDDLAETSLKRLFEGAHLPFLGGMEEVSKWKNIEIWRPFLKMRKKELLAFLEGKNLVPFFDQTNDDPHYLRSRLRKDLLPFLEQTFGKGVVDNLISLSERAQELKEYLDRKISAALLVTKGDWGFALNSQNMERIELRHFLQRVASHEGFTLPRSILDPLLNWRDANLTRKIFFQKKWIYHRKGWIIFLNSDEKKSLTLKKWRDEIMISLNASSRDINV